MYEINQNNTGALLVFAFMMIIAYLAYGWQGIFWAVAGLVTVVMVFSKGNEKGKK